MTRTVVPNPIPHRGGRRFLPVVAAFAWAVALHVALAAGLAGFGGNTREVRSSPRGFEMVQVPEATSPDQQSHQQSASSPSGRGKAPTKTGKDIARTPDPTPEASHRRRVVSARGTLKRKVATDPGPEAGNNPAQAGHSEPSPASSSHTAGQPNSKEQRSAGQRQEALPPPSRPEPNEPHKASGRGSDFQPPGVPAGYRHNQPPTYPSQARRRHQEGKVVLQVQVAPDGKPQRVTVATSSGYDTLDRAARDAVKRWRFRPARQGDKAVAGTVKVPIHFRLSQR